jgi:F0F1-type ATP synthase assembly protein I
VADGQPSRPVPGAAQLLQLGATCGVVIGVAVFCGYLLDQALGTSPLLVFVGVAVGIVGAATGSYVLIRPYLTDASIGAPKPKD